MQQTEPLAQQEDSTAPADIEQQLIERAKERDRQAFHQLYERYVKRVYAICWRLLADKNAAEEVTQDVFMSVWQQLPQFDGRSLFSTWLHAIATKQAVSHFRARRRWFERFLPFDLAANDHREYQDDYQEHGVEAAIQKLPTQARMVFVLFAIEGYRHEEIADLLNIAVGSSKAQYHRARTLLKQWLDYED